MKKARSTDDLSTFDDEPVVDENTELGQVFKKKMQNKQGRLTNYMSVLLCFEKKTYIHD